MNNASKMMRTVDEANAELVVIHHTPEYYSLEPLTDSRRSKHVRVYFSMQILNILSQEGDTLF